MSDRIAIIGGSTVGRDHFPFAVGLIGAGESFGAGYSRPFLFSIQDACEWTLRVKKFLIRLNLRGGYVTGNDTEAGPVYASYSSFVSFEAQLNSYDIAGLRLPTREVDLVLQRDSPEMALSIDAFGNITFFDDPVVVYSNPLVISNTVEGDWSGVASVAVLDLVLSLAGSGGTPDWMDGIGITPVFRAQVTGGAYGNSNSNYTEFGSLPDETGILHVQAFTNGFDGAMRGFAADGSDGDGIYLQGASVDIYAKEYWPYATKAGLPVYDTATGAQLRDPLS